jgi:hypothetical protein
MGTEICGSSWRGVIISPNTPIAKKDINKSKESGEVIKACAVKPAIPNECGLLDSDTGVIAMSLAVHKWIIGA